MTEQRIARVVWIDSSLQNSQVSLSDAPSPCKIESVGYLIVEKPEYVTLARDDMGDGWRGLVAIPRIAITTIEIVAGPSTTMAKEERKGC